MYQKYVRFSVSRSLPNTLFSLTPLFLFYGLAPFIRVVSVQRLSTCWFIIALTSVECINCKRGQCLSYTLLVPSLRMLLSNLGLTHFFSCSPIWRHAPSIFKGLRNCFCSSRSRNANCTSFSSFLCTYDPGTLHPDFRLAP